MRNVYVLESGVLNNATQSFTLSNTYFSSKKKALKYAHRILLENLAEQVVDSFEGFPNLQDGYLLAKDYVGEFGKYKARVVISKQELK
jgi:hypothetical protein